jgi:hypothetical protein
MPGAMHRAISSASEPQESGAAAQSRRKRSGTGKSGADPPIDPSDFLRSNTGILPPWKAHTPVRPLPEGLPRIMGNEAIVSDLTLDRVQKWQTALFP